MLGRVSAIGVASVGGPAVVLRRISRVTSSMRRVALLLVVGAVLGGLAVVIATPADAASGTLTVTTLDRTGHSVRSQYGAVSLKTGREYYFWTGRAHRLPFGAYDVYTAIPTVQAGADTVGVKRVRVSGAAKLTIDARKGRAVRGYLRPAAPAGFDEQTSVWLCTADGFPVAGGSSSDGPAYVIPSSLPEVEFAFSSVWSAQDADDHGATYYAGAAVQRNGAPAGMTRTFWQSNLTRFAVKGRTGLQTGPAQMYVRYEPADECRGVTLQLFPTATLPYTLTMHVPPGPWSLGQFGQDSIYGPARKYAAGHSYTANIGAAAWGPAGPLPIVDQYCRCLTGGTGRMFADPALPSGAGARVTYTLKTHGTTIAQKTIDPEMGNFAPKLPGAGWYSLSAVATRNPINPLPSNVLSLRAVLRLHFYADPSRDMRIGGYVTRFVPHGLSMANRARTKTTTVALKLLRPGTDRDVKTVSVWMSTNSGRSWHTVRVRHLNGKWWVTITNPAAGYVSLRAKVLDTHGNAATSQITRAYAIG